jgi:WD40 repeat protein
MVFEDCFFFITVFQFRYCARFIGIALNDMWLACGTVFNEILLWKVMDKRPGCDTVAVKKRLTGHYGVIFSVRYCQERQLLCSVSDDRSIKVWRAVFTDSCSDVTVRPEMVYLMYVTR